MLGVQAERVIQPAMLGFALHHPFGHACRLLDHAIEFQVCIVGLCERANLAVNAQQFMLGVFDAFIQLLDFCTELGWVQLGHALQDQVDGRFKLALAFPVGARP